VDTHAGAGLYQLQEGNADQHETLYSVERNNELGT